MIKSEGQLYSIWLVPGKPTEDAINAIIDRLSQRYGTTGFSAHATLCSGRWTGKQSELVASVEDLAGRLSALAVESIGIRQTESRFQFFFLALSADDLLNAQDLAQHILPGSRLPEVGPHLSLIYSSDSSGIDRKLLSEELQPQMPEAVVFDRLALVLPKHNNWDDIADWRLEHLVPLAD